MHLIRSSWSRLFAFLRRWPFATGLLVALFAVPLWAFTIGLAGLFYELIGRVDGARVDRRPEAKPASPRIRWGAAATSWVVAVTLIGSSSSPAPAASSEPLSTPLPQVAAATGAPATVPPTPAPVETPTPEPTPVPFGPVGETDEAEVIEVIDGDTIRVSMAGDEWSVRYIGMDTPEVGTGDPATEQNATAATEANAALVEGRTVVLERDTSETDRNGRLLRHVWVRTGDDWIHVGIELVRSGAAIEKAYPPDLGWQVELDAAEAVARDAGVGLWTPEPTPTPAPTPPPTPAPTPTPLVVASDVALVAGAADRAIFRGAAGTYAWSTVEFPEAYAIVRWDVTAGGGNCHVNWSIDPASGSTISDAVGVTAGSESKGSARYRTAFPDAVATFESTCPRWLVTVQGETPPPPPTQRPPSGGGGGGGGGGACHPSYTNVCLRTDVSDYDCAGGSGNGPYYVAGPVYVDGYDEYGLDGNNDGVGCENG